MTSLETDVMPIPDGVPSTDSRFQSRTSTQSTDAPMVGDEIVVLPEASSSTKETSCGCETEKQSVVIDPAQIVKDVEEIEVAVEKEMKTDVAVKSTSDIKLEPKTDINVALLDATEERKKENIDKIVKKIATETIVPEVAKAVETITKNVTLIYKNLNCSIINIKVLVESIFF